ncbi:NADPH-dependent curcumin reductase [Methylobacterium cerastii]|uniref:NADPH-dependent curcumin reductase n=1 Tax=Methylobacterium cerastii TaxID=932741 RepID=A0ABQ4QLZ1_9HYPH|nr:MULTISPECIES: NADP-dependent oxidoreductase [Methylobacterium]TXN04607.1 NADP-dependent oxidoreductase [Methylobacterium sp. WL122]TXN82521.1 NADP-dependent oxidoreductase [Methylobacterium sp. WL8]GJD46238.1 NADPH-dependent curcumin reductase [Methylobacterium cerastii]
MARQRNIWRLARRPVGAVAEGDLAYGAEALPELQQGQFLLQVLYLSLDPTNRIWMSDAEQYMPPVAIGEPMRGLVAGRVIESRKDGVEPGALYSGMGVWADHMVTDGQGLQPLALPPGVPLSLAFGVFGLVGPTAYFGLLDIGRPKAGETLVVSAAAGGVGQVVGQIGKIKGCRVIGIAGGPDKCRFVVDELGFDAAIDYRSEDVGARLDALAPDGVDINFEQVGGPISDAVFARMRLFGRMPLCGLIASYNDTSKDSSERPGPAVAAAWRQMLMRRLTVQGFIVTDYAARWGEAVQALGGWMAEGRIKTRQDVRPDLARAVEHLDSLYTGGNFGKLLVQVGASEDGA